jgi:mRNA-degrading endonuclease RelE of RelBE toxin-antitoxin system
VGNHHANWRAGAASLSLSLLSPFARTKGTQATKVFQQETMFQIIFNELSAAEISALPKRLQLELLAEFQILPEDLDQLDSERFGVIEREGKKLYRYRAKNYRIYFAKTDEGIKVHRVLHKNTLRDFLFRSKLPVSEDAQLGETREFWNLIEEGERTPKA